MSQPSSQGMAAAQQGQPLLRRLPVEPAQESLRIQSNHVKRKPVPVVTTVSHGPTVPCRPDSAGQNNTGYQLYSRLKDAQALPLEENEVQKFSETPST